MTALQDSRSYILDRRRPTSLMDVHILSTLSVFLSLVLMVDKLQGWQVDTRANVELKVEDTVLEVQRFGGNETSPDHFKVILSDGDSLLVGARNYVYNISLITLRENKRIKWFSSSRFIQLCTRKQKSSEQCQNYIRVIAKKSDNKILVCGTNAYKPWCRTYQDVENQYVHLTDDSGIAKCPYDPSHNNTAVYVDDQLFSGTYSDINARDALIYKRPMRTEQHDSQWLNEPNFVSSFDYKDKVYFFFRETAVEYINCGKTLYIGDDGGKSGWYKHKCSYCRPNKAVFSRVARVCKNDRGGRLLLQNTWTSFFKARLNCSIPGEFPFYFDEIQSTTEMGQGNYMPTATWNNRTDVVYAVFNTPQNSITGSAVCVYRLQDIARVFGGTFKEQETARSNWLPVNAMQIPKPHPAKQCGNSSFKDQGPMLNFIKSHTLMDEAVPAFGGRPVLVHTSFNFRLTQIVVDWQVKAADARYYDVMFLGTDDGRVIKAVNKGQEGRVETVIIEDIQVFDNRTPVVKVKLFRNQKKSQEKLVVISRDEIKAIPLHRCHLRTTCVDCVALQDPYCSWAKDRCQNTVRGIINIRYGKHPSCPRKSTTSGNTIVSSTTVTPCRPCLCPKSPSPGSSGAQNVSPSTTTENKLTSTPKGKGHSTTTRDNRIPIFEGGAKEPKTGAQRQGKTIYTASTMAIAVVVSIFLSLFVGFIFGYRVSLYRNNRQSDTPYIDSRTSDIYKNQNRYNREPHYNPSDYYGPPEKQLNVVFNPLKGSGKLPNGNTKTKVQEQHKVKKVYL